MESGCIIMSPITMMGIMAMANEARHGWILR
jgi:hypothetical protein